MPVRSRLQDRSHPPLAVKDEIGSALAFLLALLATSCTAHAPEAPPPPSPAPAPPAAAAARTTPAPTLPPLIYRRLDDSVLGRPNFTLEGPVPAHYAVVPEGAAPSSLEALLQHRKRVFVREEETSPNAPCTLLLLDQVDERRAALHHDETRKDCALRHVVRLEYEPAKLGAATIDYHAAQPRILRGCAGIGFGIALCGWPVLVVVSADERRIRFVDARAHLGKSWRLYAYDPAAVIDWYFDAEECARAAPRTARQSCG